MSDKKPNTDDAKSKDTSKVTVDSLCKQIKVMRPGAVMQFVAKQLGTNSADFINKYAFKIAGLAAKNGWVKTKDIGAAIANFSKKNKEDVTGIDFSKMEIDPSTTSFKCLFDGDAGKQISQFMKIFEKDIAEEGKEIEKADEKLHADVKKAGVEMDEEDIDKDGIVVASVIDDKKNKGKNGKELKKKIESAIKKDEQAKEIQKISKQLKKASSKVKVDKKYETMSDEELAKLDDKINKKIRNRSEASKKNDAFRSKIKNAVQKGVAEDFKKSVKTAYVSTNALKKTIAKNMKPGLAVDNIEEPRTVCISVQCGTKDFGNVLKEADGSVKIIDVTNGSKDKNIQKVIDYIKKVLQDKIGKDKLGKKTYAYLKNANGNCLLYVFAGVKQDKLDESVLNEETLTDDSPIEDIMAHVKVDGDKISGFSGGMVLSSLLKKLNVGDNKEFLKSISSDDQSIGQTQKAVELLLKRFIINNENDGANKAIKELFRSIGDDEYKKLMYSELVAKMIPKMKDKFAEKGITTIGNLQGLFDNKEIDDWVDSIASQSTLKDAAKELKDTVKDAAKEAADDIKDKATEVVDNYHYDGPARVNIHDLRDKLNLKSDKFYEILGIDQVSKHRAGERFLKLELEEFLTKYDKDPDKAIKTLLAGSKGAKADLIAELAAKLKPEAAEKFKDFGIDIDGKIGHVAAKAADAAYVGLGQAGDAEAAGVDGQSTSPFGKARPGFFFSPRGSEVPHMDFDYERQWLNREMYDIFKDGNVSAEELGRIRNQIDELAAYQVWAEQNAGSTDPMVKEKIAAVSRYMKQFNSILDKHAEELNKAYAEASDARTGATEATRAASKQMANDEELKKATANGWKEKLGLDKAFTALGWARLAAKSTSIILNNGKAVVDALGAAAIKFKEDANVIAQMNFLLTNGDNNDSKFQDSKFSVRFSVDDFKWHATCLDDRKMKFPEDEVIEKALSSEEGKKFKEVCLKKFTKIFKPKDEIGRIVPYIMKQYESIGLKPDKGDAGKMVDTIEKIESNFSKVEEAFK